MIDILKRRIVSSQYLFPLLFIKCIILISFFFASPIYLVTKNQYADSVYRFDEKLIIILMLLDVISVIFVMIYKAFYKFIYTIFITSIISIISSVVIYGVKDQTLLDNMLGLLLNFFDCFYIVIVTLLVGKRLER